MNILIDVVRHPQKAKKADGTGSLDEITPHGAMQAFAAAQAHLADSPPDFLAFSGANRTRQAARVMAAALGLDLPLHELDGFHFAKVFGEIYEGEEGRDRFFSQLSELHEAHGGQASLQDALDATNDLGRYAREGREAIQSAIIELAKSMAHGDERHALVLSHSPWTEQGFVNPAEINFGLGESDTVRYVVRVEPGAPEIVESTFLAAPLEGAGSYK